MKKSRALEQMRRDMRDHMERAPRAALRGVWESGQKNIRRRSGATRHSALPGVGNPRFRRVRRGPQYPTRGKGESDRATRHFRLGQGLYMTTDHPGGLLARGIFRSEGFHAIGARESAAYFERWKWRRGER